MKNEATNRLKKIALRLEGVTRLFKKNLLLVIILALGFYIRVDDVYSVTFDATSDAFLEPPLDFLNTHELPLLGIEVSGLINADMGPLCTYLYALPLVISKNPISVVIFSALLNTLGVLVLYLFVKDLFQKRAALITILFVSVDPFFVYHSRTISNISPLFLFIAIYFWSAFSFFVKNRKGFLVLVFFSIACLLQLHILSAVLVILSLFYFLIFRPKIDIKYALLGVLIFLFMFSMYIYYEATHSFENSVNTLQLFTLSTGISSQSESPLSIIQQLVFFNINLDKAGYYRLSNNFLNTSINLAYKRWDTISAKVEDFMFLCGLIFILLHWGFIIFKKSRLPISINKIKDLHIKSYLFLLLWVLTFLLFFVFFKINVYIRYYIYLLPVNFIVAGYFLNVLITYARRRLLGKKIKYALFIMVLCIVLARVVYLSHVNNIILKEGVVDKEIPLKNKLELVSFFFHKDIDLQDFYQNLHFIDVGESGKGGFDSLFVYLYKKDREELYTQDKSEHYFLMLNKTATQILEDGLKYEQIYNIEPYSIIEYAPKIDYSSWEISNVFYPDWFRYKSYPGKMPKIGFWPFYGTRESEEIFLRGSIEINKSENTVLVLSSRTCVENLYINEKLVVNEACQRGWRLQEIPPFEYKFNITDPARDGTNLIAMKLVNIDKHFSIEIYDMVFEK